MPQTARAGTCVTAGYSTDGRMGRSTSTLTPFLIAWQVAWLDLIPYRMRRKRRKVRRRITRMNARMRRKLKRATIPQDRIPSEYERLSSLERQVITLKSGKGIENRYNVLSARGQSLIGTMIVRDNDGLGVRKVYRISKYGYRKDRTSCMYRLGPTGKYPNG